MTIAESEKALLKADLEADMKYKQLIMEAESLLESMKNSLQRCVSTTQTLFIHLIPNSLTAYRETRPLPVPDVSIRWPISAWRCSNTARWKPRSRHHLHHR